MWEAIGRKQSAAPAPRPIRAQDDDGVSKIARATSPLPKTARSASPARGEANRVKGLRIRSACASGRLLVFLVVVDFGELGVDHVVLLGFGAGIGTTTAARLLLGSLLVHRFAELHGGLLQRVG